MNRIDAKFSQLRRAGKKAFIVYITAGDPSLAATRRLVLGLEKAGADIIELGIPFSDPLADGPTIQAASQRALKKKATLNKIFALVGALRRQTDIPIVFMTYFNPVLKHGPAAFVRDCYSCGVDGVIVPDLPCEEASGLAALSRKKGVATIFLVAPTSPRARIAAAASLSTGFIYYVSLTGVTGARRALPPEVVSRCALIKSMTKKPLAIGFGVSTPAQAKALALSADGVIVGSAIVKVVEDNQHSGRLGEKVFLFARTLSRAIHGA